MKPIPQCPLKMSEDKLDQFANYTDEEFLALAKSLLVTQKAKSPDTKAFLELPSEIVAASIKQAVQSQHPPKSKT